MGIKTNDASLAGAKLMLKLKKAFPCTIKNVYLVNIEGSEKSCYAVEVLGTNGFLDKKTSKDSFTAWNMGYRVPNGFLNSVKTTRILLELLSLQRGMKEKLYFLIYHNNNLYDLENIAMNHKVLEVNCTNIARLV